MCFSPSFFAQQVPRTVHIVPIVVLASSVVWIASAEKCEEPAISIPSAVRENAVTRMAIATLARYSAPQPPPYYPPQQAGPYPPPQAQGMAQYPPPQAKGP